MNDPINYINADNHPGGYAPRRKLDDLLFWIHTTGTYFQPAQWAARGPEWDKMSRDTARFHFSHATGEIQRHGRFWRGTGFLYVHFDRYEAVNPTWTPTTWADLQKETGMILSSP